MTVETPTLSRQKADPSPFSLSAGGSTPLAHGSAPCTLYTMHTLIPPFPAGWGPVQRVREPRGIANWQGYLTSYYYYSLLTTRYSLLTTDY